MVKRFLSIIKTQIFRRLALLLLLTLIIPYLFTTYFITTNLHKSFLDQVYRESESMLKQHDHYLQLIRVVIENDMKKLLTDYNLINQLLDLPNEQTNSASAKSIERRFNSVIRTNQFIKMIVYTSPNNKMIGVPSYAFDRESELYTDDRYPSLLAQKDYIWLPPETHAVFNENSLSIQYIGKFKNPETLNDEGYITFIIPPYVFKENIEKISVGQQGFMAITHSNGSVFALADVHSYIPEVNTILTERDLYTSPGTYDLESENYKIKIHVQARTSWILWSFISKNEVNQRVADLLSGIYISMIGGIIIIIILSIFLSLLLISPVQRLTDALSNITNGEYGIYLQHKMPMELNEIKEKFNIMTSALDSKEKQISHQIKTIEEISIQERSARQEIEKTWDYFSSIINSMNSALIACNQDKTITHLNEHAINEFALQAGDKLTPESLHQLFNSIELEELFTNRKDAIFIAKAGGNGHFFDIMVFEIENDRGLGFTIEDVSKRIHLEQMMMTSERMMNLGSLAAGMAHEINNPLSGIMQNVQVLESRLKKAGKSNSQLQDCIEKQHFLEMTELIAEASQKASIIVKNMLQFSQKTQKDMSRQKIGALVNEALELAEKDIQLRKIFKFPEVSVFVTKNTKDDNCYCVESEIIQLFLNLFKFHSHRLVKNDVKDLSITIDSEDEYVTIRSFDSASPVPEKDIPSIFEPFHYDDTDNPERGLGLALSYYIVSRRHHGKISIENNKGSIVKIMLPKKFNT